MGYLEFRVHVCPSCAIFRTRSLSSNHGWTYPSQWSSVSNEHANPGLFFFLFFSVMCLSSRFPLLHLRSFCLLHLLEKKRVSLLAWQSRIPNRRRPASQHGFDIAIHSGSHSTPHQHVRYVRYLGTCYTHRGDKSKPAVILYQSCVSIICNEKEERIMLGKVF